MPWAIDADFITRKTENSKLVAIQNDTGIVDRIDDDETESEFVQRLIDLFSQDNTGSLRIETADYRGVSVTIPDNVTLIIDPDVKNFNYTIEDGANPHIIDQSTREERGKKALDTEEVFLGQLTSTPSDSEIGSGNTAFYAKDDGNLYKKPYGGSEEQVGGGGVSEYTISSIIHTSFDAGLTDEEYDRIQLQSGESLEVTRVECRYKGGGTSADFTVEVYDNGTSSIIDSANAGETSTTGGTSGSGNLVTILISNATGASQIASFKVYGKITT